MTKDTGRPEAADGDARGGASPSDGRDPASRIRTACPLCGHPFTRAEYDACRQGCPMAGSCSVVRCPNCGHEFPRPGPAARWLEKLLRGKGGGTHG